MAGMTGVPFWINLRDASTIASNAKTKGVKPLMAGMACPFIGASTPESIGNSVISSITTEVSGAEGILHKRSCKYSS